MRNYFVTGDTHGEFYARLKDFEVTPDETCLIILGDAGINYYLSKRDSLNKKMLQHNGCIFYCVRGNHEERPSNISTMEQWFDSEIHGTVYREVEYPNIRYLIDGRVYLFNNHPTLVVGGAYSVDKYYRISQYPKDSRWTGWFKDELLTQAEMEDISERINGHHFDFILSHTCPASWQPFDLFISGLDQSKVDKSMEIWMESLKDSLSWNAWLFGHFHDDRLVRPGVEMYFTDIENLETIYQRWTSGAEPDWWLKKDPNYYF